MRATLLQCWTACRTCVIHCTAARHDCCHIFASWRARYTLSVTFCAATATESVGRAEEPPAHDPHDPQESSHPRNNESRGMRMNTRGWRLRALARVVWWHHTNLPCLRPGFDSRRAHFESRRAGWVAWHTVKRDSQPCRARRHIVWCLEPGRATSLLSSAGGPAKCRAGF